MKIECVREKLIEAVSKAEKITGKNLTLPVLSCILFEAKGRNLIIRATNLDLGIEINIPVKVEKEGIVAVPGNIISSFLSHIPESKNVILDVIEGNLQVKTDTNVTLIKSVSPDDFPTIPPIEAEKTFTLESKDFIKGVKSVWYSSATTSMKPELSSVSIACDDDTLIFAATDSFRLAEKKVKFPNLKEFGSILLPVKNIPEILRVLETSKGTVEVSLNKNQIAFKFEGTYITSRLVDGVFPDYRQIIPKEYKTKVVVLKQDLINALKAATIFSDKFNKLSLTVRPEDKKFELATRNADVGEYANKLDAVIEGEDLDINFNYKYITDSFQSLDADSVTFEFGGMNRPLIIKGVNDKSFMYLAMSMNK